VIHGLARQVFSSLGLTVKIFAQVVLILEPHGIDVVLVAMVVRHLPAPFIRGPFDRVVR